MKSWLPTSPRFPIWRYIRRGSHPAHGSCPSIEAGLGTIGPGQTKVTRAFANAGSCGFHDHINDTNAGLRGTITIQ